jgi:cobyric acid synthase
MRVTTGRVIMLQGTASHVGKTVLTAGFAASRFAAPRARR